ncbi:MAG TPA: S1 RNA-binding domain-containing protein [Tepidisphaeraceae bacterium]|jgi:small subunit ribosomal protein S1|nr:S1 RNA-binding domain-containing protein [Tepidisphaeraceae bacterium]
MANSADPLREKFRPQTDAALEQELDAAFAGLSMDDLLSQDAAAPAQSGGGTPATTSQGKQVRTGRIVSIGKEDVFVDLGGKSQGVVSILQFEDVEPVIGQEMEFIVDRYDQREGLLVLNRKGAAATNVSWENLDVGQVVEATVTGVNKGGLECDVKGMRAFMPAGQVDMYFNPDLSTLVGQKFTAEVTKFEREAKNLVLSRRVILEREKEEKRKVLIEELAEGQVRRGVVRNVLDFGAFVDLGGVDGLLHVSEMTFKRGVKPSEVVKAGDVLDVKITKFDKETGKMSLSLNQARGIDPWAEAASKYGIGTTVTGRVTKLESFGAFIEVEEGFEGLLPISEISFKRIRHPSEVIKEGDTVKVVVLSIDPAARRCSFSMKQAGPNPWSTIDERYAPHSVIEGTVTRVAEFGAFVELEPGLEGLVHISELSDRRVSTASSVVSPGQVVKVQVMEIDKDARRVSLSLKRASEGARSATARGEVAVPTPAAPISKKKRPQLRGGLDH